MSDTTFDIVTVTMNPALDQMLVIPGFKQRGVNRVQSESRNPGGKGVNVATALAEYGMKVAVTGFLGQTNRSLFEQHFTRWKIRNAFITLEGSTRTSIKIIDPDAHETTDINFPGLTPGTRDIHTLLKRIETLEAPWFVLSGSLPATTEHGLYARLISLLKARGKSVALDTSGLPLREAIHAGPTLIKPNLHELEELRGKTIRGHRAIRAEAVELLQHGVETVAVSRGAEGVSVITPDTDFEVPAPAISVTNTVGAGDAFVAGYLAGRLQSLPPRQCTRLGIAFSSHRLTGQSLSRERFDFSNG